MCRTDTLAKVNNVNNGVTLYLLKKKLSTVNSSGLHLFFPKTSRSWIPFGSHMLFISGEYIALT